MTGRPICDDLIAESNAGRDRFVRAMILEMYRLSGQMHALAELMTKYIGDDAGSETDEHQRAPLNPASAPVRPQRTAARSSAMASHGCDVGAAPAGTAERPPQPIHESDSAPPPRAVPAGPPAVDRPRVQSEDMPLPQPAPFPAVQNEGAGIQGEDHRAQKEDGCQAASAGAASAGHSNADPRNSSRASSVDPSGPAGGERTRTERALDLWSTTDWSEEQIADAVGCKVSSIRGFVYLARKKGDARGQARAMPHDAKRAELRAQAAPVLIKKPAPSNEDRGPTMAGIAREVERKPFAPPAPAKPIRLVGVVIDLPGSVVSIDSVMGVVACPGGDWQASKPVIRTIAKMRNGELFDARTLAEEGRWVSVDYFLAQAKAWQRDLTALGVDLVIMPKVGCRIRLAESI